MVILRLRRQGRSHDAHYRIVAQEKRSKLNGKYIESVGHYHPTVSKNELVINSERVEHWLKNGAQISDTVTNLLVKEGILPKESKISQVYSLKKKQAADTAKKDKTAKTEEAKTAKTEEAKATTAPAAESNNEQPEGKAEESADQPEEPAETVAAGDDSVK